ncbi:DrmE family protein [Bacillus sp. B190/17]|uniref:DrmE family protein n=1 Tax=Bacillus lumedeiriae TaxID=3058829 RepID=A0ABW8IDA9_9BACI
MMNFNNVLGLYNVKSSAVLFRHVESNELLPLADSIENYRSEIQNRYDNDEHLIELLNLLRRMFFKLTSSFLPYNRAVSDEGKKLLLAEFLQVKRSYPELFSSIVIHVAQSFKQVIDSDNNYLSKYLKDYINSKSEVGLKIAVVTKRAVSAEERLIISEVVKSYLKTNYYTENSFRKDTEIFDEIIYIGSPNYFGEYVSNTFKGKIIAFISYDIFTNSIMPKEVFKDVHDSGAYSTIFDNVNFSNPVQKRIKINLEERESLNIAVNKFLEEQKKVEDNSHDTVEVCIVYLENDRFLFAPIDSKIRVFTPHEKSNYIKQISFKDVEADDYIVIRNERDTKLIAEVADQNVLKSAAEDYRVMQREWKRRLRLNVEKKGLKSVSGILMRKYDLKTASMASVRSWCNEESICPIELPKLLKALKYDQEKIEEVYSAMRTIQSAHRKAGRIISEKLMNELTNDILKDLQENGFYTFESKEFNGASFNIERIVSIDRSRHLIAPSNLMKPINTD